jgi:hypothetical protein
MCLTKIETFMCLTNTHKVVPSHLICTNLICTNLILVLIYLYMVVKGVELVVSN